MAEARASGFSGYAGWFLVAVGGLITAFALVIWRDDPTATLNPLVAVVWGTAGVILMGVGLLLMGRPAWSATKPSPSWPARLAMAAGWLGFIALIGLVVARATPYQDGTMSDAAFFVPTALGLVAVGLGVVGMATSRRDGPSLRWSMAGLLMGVGSAAIPVWLWSNHRYFFASFF